MIWSNSQFTFCTINFVKVPLCRERWKTNLGDTGSYGWASNTLRFEKLKRFHISNTGNESISHSLHNLTNNIYVTANNNNNNKNKNKNNKNKKL